VLEYFAEKRARDITADVVDAFLDHLASERKLSSVERESRNPVAAVKHRPEPPGRDRIVPPGEFRLLWDKAGGDREMRAFLALAGTMPLVRHAVPVASDRAMPGATAAVSLGLRATIT
jgi:hypothetical protein